MLKLMSRYRDSAHCKQMVEGADVNLAHTKQFLLNYFEDALDSLGDNKEVESGRNLTDMFTKTFSLQMIFRILAALFIFSGR